MDVLARWLVRQPLHILCVGVALMLLWVLLRQRPYRARRAKALLVAGLGWLGYAGWEWWVLVETPEADMRVDLLVIWPFMAILTLWAILRVSFPLNTGVPRQDT